MTHRVERDKWILYRHTSNFDLISAVAANLKTYSKTSISEKDKKELLLKLKELEYYKERNPELPLDAINHRINTLAYYMFGYKAKVYGEDRFLFSPLGNLFLKNIANTESISKIFLSMLWAVQYPHPHGGSSYIFNLFPFRLIFKLLSDKRLNHRLYAYEVAYYVVFVENINTILYEDLVKKILNIRTWSDTKIEAAFKKEEHVLVNAIYEWDYYISTLFEGANIIKKHEGDIICKLTHGKSTKRSLTRNYVVLNDNIKKYCTDLLLYFPYDEVPLNLFDKERMKQDIIADIYSFYPKILLKEIGEIDSDEDFNAELLELPKLIEQYANNNDGEEAYLFEDILTEGFNLFYNVEAKKVGKAGNTDIECLYLTKKKKFAVDAKSTKNKLMDLSSGRLASHREKIGGEYTIVITPRYVRGVLTDIKSSPVVLILASTFAEYLYNHINNNIREIDYTEFDDIIHHNYGKDISKHISQLTIDKFATRKYY